MTSNPTDLIERLRQGFDVWNDPYTDLCEEAANTLTQQESEKEALREVVRKAYHEGWYINAIEPDDDAHANYISGCEQVDWEASIARAALPTTDTREEENGSS